MARQTKKAAKAAKAAKPVKTGDIEVLYEDKDFVVVNKPAGLAVHADGKRDERTLADWLVARYPARRGYAGIEQVGEPITLASGGVIWKPGIVHRLDRDTTGVLLVAKNQPAYLFAKEQFQARTTEKAYRAFVYGQIAEERGRINRAIGRSSSDFRKWTAQRGTRGELRDAVTDYEVLARGTADDGTPSGALEGYTYLEAKPKTGRTHQIRVHFKAINHPVVSDPLYAESRLPGLGFARTALHALSLAFALPSGKRVTVEAPLPPDFEKALAMLKTA